MMKDIILKQLKLLQALDLASPEETLVFAQQFFDNICPELEKTVVTKDVLLACPDFKSKADDISAVLDYLATKNIVLTTGEHADKLASDFRNNLLGQELSEDTRNQYKEILKYISPSLPGLQKQLFFGDDLIPVGLIQKLQHVSDYIIRRSDADLYNPKLTALAKFYRVIVPPMAQAGRLDAVMPSVVQTAIVHLTKAKRHVSPKIAEKIDRQIKFLQQDNSQELSAVQALLTYLQKPVEQDEMYVFTADYTVGKILFASQEKLWADTYQNAAATFAQAITRIQDSDVRKQAERFLQIIQKSHQDPLRKEALVDIMYYLTSLIQRPITQPIAEEVLEMGKLFSDGFKYDKDIATQTTELLNNIVASKNMPYHYGAEITQLKDFIESHDDKKVKTTGKEFVMALQEAYTPTSPLTQKNGLARLAKLTNQYATYVKTGADASLLKHTQTLILAEAKQLPNPSAGKKIAGAALAFVSAVAFAACITGIVLSAGVATKPLAIGAILSVGGFFKGIHAYKQVKKATMEEAADDFIKNIAPPQQP